MLTTANIKILESLHNVWDYDEYLATNPSDKIPLEQYAVQVGVLLFSKFRWPNVAAEDAVTKWLNISNAKFIKYRREAEEANKKSGCGTCGGGGKVR